MPRVQKLCWYCRHLPPVSGTRALWAACPRLGWRRRRAVPPPVLLVLCEFCPCTVLVDHGLALFQRTWFVKLICG